MGALNDDVSIWDSETGKILKTLKVPGVFSKAPFVIFPDGKKVLTRDAKGNALVWDVETGKVLQTLNNRAKDGDLFPVAVFPDGKRVLTTLCNTGFNGRTSTTRCAGGSIWDTDTGQLLKPLKEGSSFFSYPILLLDDGKVVTNSSDGMVRVWDPNTDKEPQDLMKGFVKSLVSFSDGKKRLAEYYGDSIHFMDTKTGQEDKTLKVGAIEEMAFFPDGKKVVVETRKFYSQETGSLKLVQPSSIKLLDVGSGRELQTLKDKIGEHEYITIITISPDGKKIMAGFGDGTIRLWDTSSP
jgi:WD40 repeat protein